MDAADLHDRVTFQPPLETPIGFGHVAAGFGTGSQMRANFKYLNVGESVIQARMAGRETIIVTIRANNLTRTIDGSWRMRDEKTARIYNVTGAKELHNRRWIEVMVMGGDVNSGS
jgi:head-tail adaptor